MINKDKMLYILSNAPIEEIMAYSSEQLEALFGKPIAIQKEYSQNNPHHCYTLLEHTLRTVDGIRKMQIDENDKNILLISALYHDIGKPYAKIDKGYKYVFYNHAEKSKVLAFPLLQEMELSQNEIDRILFFIEFHDSFINYKLPGEAQNQHSVTITTESIKRFVKKHTADGCNVKDLILLVKLSMADVSAQSEIVKINNKIVDTRERKIERLAAIEKLLVQAV